MFRLVLEKENSSVQKVPMNLPSMSLIMLAGTLYSFTTCLKNSWAINSTKHYLGVGIKVTYFENQSMITKMASCSPTFRRWVMKSMDTLSHSLDGTCKGSRSPAIFVLSTLSCWQMRQVFVYYMISSRILGQK